MATTTRRNLSKNYEQLSVTEETMTYLVSIRGMLHLLAFIKEQSLGEWQKMAA